MEPLGATWPGMAIHNPRMERLVEERKKHMCSIYLCGDGVAHPRRDDRRVGAVRCGDARRDAWRCGALPMYQEHSGLKSYTNLTSYHFNLLCSIIRSVQSTWFKFMVNENFSYVFTIFNIKEYFYIYFYLFYIYLFKKTMIKSNDKKITKISNNLLFKNN